MRGHAVLTPKLVAALSAAFWVGGTALWGPFPVDELGTAFAMADEPAAKRAKTEGTDALSFISDICGTLKRLKRTGWVMRKVPLPESDSDHMHRCAMCAMLLTQPADLRDDYTAPGMEKFHPEKVDTVRLLRMAVSHDLCEALAGDITPYCNPTLVASKHEKEKEAMQAIRKVVGDPLGQELFELWAEYEELKTVEAIYCKDIDKFEMVVQAYEYEKEHLRPLKDLPGSKTPLTNSVGEEKDLPTVCDEPLRRFFISTNQAMVSPLFRRLDQELRARREALLQERGWAVTDSERQQPRPHG